jgi:tetratricopeptide (TPR) repeat protein
VVATDLDPRFTFDTFIVGPANRLAAAAARRVADAPGTSYNPLFIYSSSGLGKSHILNGIAHYAARVHPGYGVVYVTVESFFNELTQAVQAGSEGELRERYEELHMLLLDDVQFFTGQNEAQEMLLRLLDGMNKSGGQVVLASDRLPGEINGLDERLLTRFSGGLIVDIAAPEYETKVAIIRKKGEERGQTFEPGVAEALAKHPFSSVRELAGALNKVLAIQELDDRLVQSDEIDAIAGLIEAAPREAPIVGQQLLDEFGSFMEELSHTVANKVEREEEPWRRLLRETAEIFENDGYSGTRLRRILEGNDAPPDPQELATLDEAEKLNGDDAGLSLARGIVQMKSGDGVAAMDSLMAYQEKLGSEQAPPIFYAFTVMAAGLAGDMGQALKISEEGLQLYPDEGAILVNSGAILEHRGDSEGATAYYERAIKGDAPPPQAYKALGGQALGRGDKAQAQKQYEAALQEDPRLGEDILLKLGAILLESSNAEGAAGMWRRALDLNPDNLTIRTKLDQLGAAAGT